MLNQTDAADTNNSTVWQNVAPTSSVFYSSTGGYNDSGQSLVFYCWAEIPGYSSFGKYKGNGHSSTGTYMHLGFRPAFLVLKRTDDSKSWVLFDNKRSPFNLVDKSLYPNRTDGDNGLSNLEVDFLSNGFKIKNSVNTINASDGTYVYMAFADQQGQTPFNTFPNAS